MLDCVTSSNSAQTVQKIGNCSYRPGHLQLIGTEHVDRNQAGAMLV